MMARAAIGLLGLLGRLPLPALRALGAWLGRALFVLAVPRRRVALRNLELCFPDVPAAQRRAWARQSFEVFCQTFLDRGWLWAGSEALVRSRVKLVGALHELDGDTPTIVFAPHFYSMDAGGLALPLNTQREFTSIFATHPDPVQDAWFMAGRQRFGRCACSTARTGSSPSSRACARAACSTCCPTWTTARPIRSSCRSSPCRRWRPFPRFSRFARLGRAKVVALYSRMTPEGYVAELTPAWENFPTDDAVADTARMNRELEAAIMTMPSQYYWVHRRFKTRPEGEPSVY